MGFWRAVTRGFTLIEMAIVLVVVGLLLSGGLLAVAPVLESSRVSDTKARMDKIESALLVYGMQYGCLPCPANGALASTNAAAGYASDQNGGAYSPAATCTADLCITTDGVVPWLTIGLSEAEATDPWGTRITYQLSSNNGVTACSGSAFGSRNGNLQSSNSFDRETIGSTPCYPLGWIRVENAVGNALVTGGGAAEGAAYVLVSHGPDHAGGRAQGTGTLQAATSTSTDQPENADGDATFVQDDTVSADGTNYFDDIVRWRTAPVLIQGCGASACGNPE